MWPLTARVDSAAAIVEAAKQQCGVTTVYDPSYYRLDYPNGDIPIHKGVCTDVIIRAFRAVKIDFQKLVHRDMKSDFADYPQIWGLKSVDPNIDHRRVPNLQKYLERKGKKLPVSNIASDYLPGDIVTWKLPGNLDHIGLVSDVRVEGTDRFGIVHNIGYGAVIEDILFEYSITGHYRFFGN
jgi:hypothetical protein